MLHYLAYRLIKTIMYRTVYLAGIVPYHHNWVVGVLLSTVICYIAYHLIYRRRNRH